MKEKVVLSHGEGKPPTQLKHGAYKFDRAARDKFLEHFVKNGRTYMACKVAGVCLETFRRFRRYNIEGFADEFAEAQGLFRDRIEEEIQRRALEGVQEPIIGGKDRDEIVTYVTRYSDRLLETLARRHIPEYRDKGQLDVNVSGGVMVVPAKAEKTEDWSAQYGDLEAPSADAEEDDDTAIEDKRDE